MVGLFICIVGLSIGIVGRYSRSLYMYSRSLYMYNRSLYMYNRWRRRDLGAEAHCDCTVGLFIGIVGLSRSLYMYRSSLYMYNRSLYMNNRWRRRDLGAEAHCDCRLDIQACSWYLQGQHQRRRGRSLTPRACTANVLRPSHQHSSQRRAGTHTLYAYTNRDSLAAAIMRVHEAKKNLKKLPCPPSGISPRGK